MKRLRIVLFLGILPCLHSQEIIRTETTEVLVDVSVRSRKGTVDTPLLAKDFSLWEDGKPQKINSASSVAADAEAAQKHFVIYFDFSGMPVADQATSQRVAGDFIDALAAPDRYMAVVSWNGRNPVVLQHFTNAKDALKKAVAMLPNPGNRQATELRASLTSVCQSIGKAAGRKLLLLFSANAAGGTEFYKPMTSACNRANVAIDTIRPRPADGNFTSELGRRANPASAIPQTGGIDTGQMGAFGVDPQAIAAVADSLAKETGGEALLLNEALNRQLAAAVREQDENYQLAYTPPPAKEGSCHKLRVTTTARVDLRARNEYCTEKPVDLVAGKIAGQALESRAGTGNFTAVMQLPFFYTGTNRVAVHLVADILPTGMKFEKDQTGFHGQIDIVGTVVRADGFRPAKFADTVTLDQPDQQHVDTFTKTIYRYEHQFTVPAGTYTFQLALGAGPSAVAKLEAPLTIAPWNSSTFGISALAMAPEARVIGTADASEGLMLEGKGPLVASGTQFVPSATNRFRSAGPIYFYMEIYAPGVADGAVLQYRILDRKTGDLKTDSGVGGLAEFIRPGNPVIPFGARLNVAELTAGTYRLEVRASSAPGTAVSTRFVDFEVE